MATQSNNYDQLKQQALDINLLDFLQGQGLEFRRSGNTYVTYCPIHGDGSKPSLTVYTHNNSWYCFGACRHGGDIIEYVQKRENCGFKESLQIITGQKPNTRNQQPMQNKQQTAIRRGNNEQNDMFLVGQKLYSSASDDINHEYTNDKKLTDETLREIKARQSGGKLIIPRYRGGKVVQWQVIYKTNNETMKKTWGKEKDTNGKPIGGSVTFGNLKGAKIIAVGEGVATCASVWQPLKIPTIAAMNLSRLEEVVKAVIKNTEANVILLVDNDKSGSGQINGSAISRISDRILLATPPTFGDWSDVYLNDGPDAVKVLINSVIHDKVKKLSPCGSCAPNGLSKVFDGEKLECVNCGECYDTLPDGMNAGQTKYEKRTYSKELEKAALVPLFGRGE